MQSLRLHADVQGVKHPKASAQVHDQQCRHGKKLLAYGCVFVLRIRFFGWFKLVQAQKDTTKKYVFIETTHHIHHGEGSLGGGVCDCENEAPYPKWVCPGSFVSSFFSGTLPKLCGCPLPQKGRVPTLKLAGSQQGTRMFVFFFFGSLFYNTNGLGKRKNKL